MLLFIRTDSLQRELLRHVISQTETGFNNSLVVTTRHYITTRPLTIPRYNITTQHPYIVHVDTVQVDKITDSS